MSWRSGRSEIGGSGLPEGQIVEEFLIAFAGLEESLEVGGTIGLRPGPWGRVLESGEFSIAEKIEDIEIDLGEDAADLRLGEWLACGL